MAAAERRVRVVASAIFPMRSYSAKLIFPAIKFFGYSMSHIELCPGLFASR